MPSSKLNETTSKINPIHRERKTNKNYLPKQAFLNNTIKNMVAKECSNLTDAQNVAQSQQGSQSTIVTQNVAKRINNNIRNVIKKAGVYNTNKKLSMANWKEVQSCISKTLQLHVKRNNDTSQSSQAIDTSQPKSSQSATR